MTRMKTSHEQRVALWSSASRCVERGGTPTFDPLVVVDLIKDVETMTAEYEAWISELEGPTPHELLERIAALEAQLKTAGELSQEMIGYVPEYFRNKWKLDERLRALGLVAPDKEVSTT